MGRPTINFLAGLAVVPAAILTVSCGSTGGSVVTTTPPPAAATGSVVSFGTDSPLCGVESFVVTITSASLVPQGGGTPVTLITSTAPATVDFARLVDFTDILGVAGTVPVGTYTGLQLTLANPQLVVLNNSSTPPAPVSVPVTFTAATSTFNINPGLVVTSGSTAGLTLDFNQSLSLQIDDTVPVTATLTPNITVTATTSGSSAGAADLVNGIIQSVSSTNLPTGFTGSFALALHGGMGQTLTVLTNSDTVFEGDGVTSFSNLTANTFVEISVAVNTSGQIVAAIVDSEEQTSTISQRSAFLGQIINVTRPAGTAVTEFTLLVDDEIPDLSSTVPLHSTLNVTLQGTVQYLSNSQPWNAQGFTFGSLTMGLGENVAVYGVLQAGSTLAADHIYLRPQYVLGNFQSLQMAGSDDKTGGFAMVPCGGLFGGQGITAVTYFNTYFTGVSGLTALATSPMLDTTGLLFYQETSGTTPSGVSWTAPTWVIQAIGVHQPPN